jgi:hypothetical protein
MVPPVAGAVRPVIVVHPCCAGRLHTSARSRAPRCTRSMEVGAETVQRLLDTLMPHAVGVRQDVREQW